MIAHFAQPTRHARYTALLVAVLLAGCQSTVSKPVVGPRERLQATPAKDHTFDLGPDIRGLAPGSYSVIDGKAAPIPLVPMGDPATVRRLIDEGTHRSRVMEVLSELCAIGPRLTGSSDAHAACVWSADQFRSWGLSAEVAAWGECATRFDRGPSTGRVLKNSTRRRSRDTQPPEWSPVREIVFTTLAWSRGTDGPVRGRVVRMPETDEQYAKLAADGSLKGAWVLLRPTPMGGRTGVRSHAAMMGERFKSQIEARQNVAGGTPVSSLPLDQRVLFDGIAGFISAQMDERDRVLTSAAPGWRDRTVDQIPTTVELSVRLSDYDFINSRLSDDDEFMVEVDATNVLSPGPIPLYNVIAEVSGSTRPDEYVYVMGHLDSWNTPGSQGAQDNGVGAAVTMEAARLLVAAKAQPARTIRFCLWTGEEQGLLGAKAYVESLPPGTADRISIALNDDGGTNYQGGLAVRADMVRVLAAATSPVNGWYVDSQSGRPMVVNIRNKGDEFPWFPYSDHHAFVLAGVPGVFWDEVGRQDYSWSWHTQHDTIEYAVPEYLMQSAMCTAITAYNLACAPELLPRVPKEEPRRE